METSNINEIESFLYDIYIKNYKNKLKISKCDLNNKKYIIDYLKMNYLSSKIDIVNMFASYDKNI